MLAYCGDARQRFGPVAEGFGIPFDPDNPRPAALACATLCEAFQLTATAGGDRVALVTPDGGVRITWRPA